MRETAGEEVAEAAVREGRGASQEPDFPLSHKRSAKALAARSQTARTLPSGSSAFRILMAGSSISMFGSRISTVAFPMLVLRLGHSPFVAGFFAFAVIAPSMLVYIPAGVLVDRWNPRRVMLVSELLRGLAIASVVVALAIFWKHTNIWLLMFAMVAEEIFEIFSTLADRRYLTMLTERDNLASRSLTSRQAYVEVRTHAVILAGRPLGPLLFEIQPFLPFLADALSFVFSIGSLLALRRSDEFVQVPRRIPRRHLAKDIGQAFGWLKDDRRAWLTLILMALTSLVAQALILMFLSEAHSKELSTFAIGIVLAASGAGGVAGSVCSRFLPDEIRRLWLPIQMVAWTVALALLALSGGLSVFGSAAAMLILGLTGAIGNIEFGTYLVSHVADDMIARVTGISQMLAIGATALGPVVGGAAAQHYGIQSATEVLLVSVMLLAFLSLFAPAASQKVAELRQSLSPSARAPGGSLNEKGAGSWRGSEAIGITVPDGAAAASRCRQPGNSDLGREFSEDKSGILSGHEIVDHGR